MNTYQYVKIELTPTTRRRTVGRVNTEDRSFAELSPNELLAILRLRAEVFVVEQACVYLDIDGRDDEAGTRHIWVDNGGRIAAYLRLLDDGEARRVGRVVTRPDDRGEGLAAKLMHHTLETSDGPWVLDSQCYLEPWYASLGFVRTGSDYDDDGVMHLPMHRHVGEVG